jgi:hypothetical protein
VAKGDTANSIHVGTRVDPEVLRQIDAVAKSASKPGLRIKRSAAVRMLIMRGLAAVNEQKPGSGK